MTYEALNSKKFYKLATLLQKDFNTLCYTLGLLEAYGVQLKHNDTLEKLLIKVENKIIIVKDTDDTEGKEIN